MNTTRYGIFTANSESALLLFCIDHDLSAIPTFETMLEAAAQELDHNFCDYLMFADAATMIQDENEVEWDYYAFDSTELAKQSALITAHIADEERIFKIIFEALHIALNDARPLSVDASNALATYRSIVADKIARADAALPEGTLVYLGPGSSVSYPAFTPVPFNASRMDARTVLLASAVDVAGAKGLVESFPMPPHLAKRSGKYWGRLKADHKVTWMANKKADFAAKAAVHLAWEARQ